MTPNGPLGVLGLVAGQIAQQYGRPTILLTEDWLQGATAGPSLARGSARSVAAIDLYPLVKAQDHLLTSFGGHPYAAGLSLPIDNIPLFREAINQQLRQTCRSQGPPALCADLVVTVATLAQDEGKWLFRQLKRLEPYGMGNPVPKLLIQNCWFDRIRHRNIQDWKGRKIQYIKSEFQLHDPSTTIGFPGVWWGHYRDDIPPERCDAVVELDFNAGSGTKQPPRYEVRLIALRPTIGAPAPTSTPTVDWLLDWRPGCPSGKLSPGLQLEPAPATRLQLH